MSNSAISISSSTAKSLFTEVEKIEKSLAKLKKKLFLSLPAKYGSKDWWEKEIVLGEKEIANKDYRVYKTANDLITDLHKGV